MLLVLGTYREFLWRDLLRGACRKVWTKYDRYLCGVWSGESHVQGLLCEEGNNSWQLGCWGCWDDGKQQKDGHCDDASYGVQNKKALVPVRNRVAGKQKEGGSHNYPNRFGIIDEIKSLILMNRLDKVASLDECGERWMRFLSPRSDHYACWWWLMDAAVHHHQGMCAWAFIACA